MRLSRVAAVVLVGLPFLGCRPPPAEDPNALELRTYDVPPGAAAPLVKALGTAFYSADKLIGRAAVTPSGQVLVTAPHSVQLGVQAVVDEVAKHPPQPERALQLRYWVLLARPSASPPPPPPELAEIQPALAEIAASQGPQTFTVAQRVRLSGLSGQASKVETDQLRVEQQIVETAGSAIADVDIHYAKEEHISTRISAGPDQIVVLGATGQPAGDSANGATLYYVVRVAAPLDGQHP